MIYWTPLGGKQEIPGLLGEKMIYCTPLEKKKILDILGTKKEVLNLLLRNTPMILFHLAFLFFNLIFYIIHLFLDFIYVFKYHCFFKF